MLVALRILMASSVSDLENASACKPPLKFRGLEKLWKASLAHIHIASCVSTIIMRHLGFGRSA